MRGKPGAGQSSATEYSSKGAKHAHIGLRSMVRSPTTPASPASSKLLIESDRVESTAVYGSDGTHLGIIKRLMIEKVSGQVAYAIISFTGFLAPGQNLHTIPWGKLKYDKGLG